MGPATPVRQPAHTARCSPPPRAIENALSGCAYSFVSAASCRCRAAKAIFSCSAFSYKFTRVSQWPRRSTHDPLPVQAGSVCYIPPAHGPLLLSPLVGFLCLVFEESRQTVMVSADACIGNPLRRVLMHRAERMFYPSPTMRAPRRALNVRGAGIYGFLGP
jgi:hypothetical protein